MNADIDIKKIRNIVFDLGNVLVELYEKATYDAFAKLGFAPFLNAGKHPEVFELMHRLGLGLVTPEQFYEQARQLTGLSASDDDLKSAANAMLVDIPQTKKEALLRLRSEGHRVFLLSNTNDIHWEYCAEKLFPYDGHSAVDFFDDIFLSQRMHLDKPNAAIYEEVSRRASLSAADTLFIDDRADNCAAAQASVGWHVFQNKGLNDWLQLL